MFICPTLFALSTLDPYTNWTQQSLLVQNGIPGLFLNMRSASLSHLANGTNIYLIAQARKLVVSLDPAFLPSSYVI